MRAHPFPCHIAVGPQPERRRRPSALGGAAPLLSVAALLAALCVGPGCSTNRGRLSDDDSDPDTMGMVDKQPTKPGMLYITPNPIDLVADGTEQRIQLSVRSSTYGDVTKKVSWSLSDPSVGAVDKTRGMLIVRGGRGGRSALYATYGVQNGSATLNVKAKGPDLVDASAPPNAKDFFDGPSGGPAPSWVYPFATTMLPRNLGQMNLQWNAASGAMVYRVRIDSPTYSRDLYVGSTACPAGQCRLQPPDAEWDKMAQAMAGTDVKVTLSASAGIGQPVGSVDLAVSISPEDVKGGLYYWSTSIRGVYRVPLGAKTAQVFINNGNEYGCAGCHAVSRDGKKVALEFGSANGTGGGVVDGTDGKKYIIKPPMAGQWNLQTFSPKGDMLIVNWQKRGRVIDSTSGAKLYDMPEQLAQPEWSPDGESIVYVRYPAGGGGDEWNASNIGDIVVMPFNGGAFGAATTIVAAQPGSEYHFYPSWTPDSKWIIFNTCKGSSCNTYDPRNTVLRIVRATAGSKPIALAQAGHQMSSGTNWPRVAPFVQNGKLIFFTFSARFPYGFVKTNQNPQIWMAGVDLDKAENKPDEDPSFAPFWLPSQNPNENNHLGTWTTDVVCVVDDQCPSELKCIMGSCVPQIG